MKSRNIIRGAGLAGALAILLSLGGPASAKSSSPSNWHVGVYNPSGRALSSAQASNSAGLATLSFTTTPDTALLTTSQGSQNGNVLGNDAGKTITATFHVAGNEPFTYYGEGTPDNPCGRDANARLYFATSNAGGFAPENYWWSNPASADLHNGSFTVTAQVSPEQWSDWNGQGGTTVPDGFAKAASNVKEIGLSFGGGCFFENGVGAPNGATLTLDSFTAS